VVFLTWAVAVLVCILLHELGHALVMQAYGYFASIVLYAFGGLAIPRASHPGTRRPGPWGNMLIAFAGPASGFIVAAIMVLGCRLLGYPVIFRQDHSWYDVVPMVAVPNLTLFYFVNFVLEVSVLWGLINLLPIFPLDGGQIAQQVFALMHPQDAVRQSLVLSVVVAGIMAMFFVMQAFKASDGGTSWQSFYLPFFFGYLAYTNYMTLQSSRGGLY